MWGVKVWGARWQCVFPLKGCEDQHTALCAAKCFFQKWGYIGIAACAVRVSHRHSQALHRTVHITLGQRGIGPELLLEDIIFLTTRYHLRVCSREREMTLMRAPEPPAWWPRNHAAHIVRGEAEPDALLNWMWLEDDARNPPVSGGFYMNHFDVALAFHPDVAHWLRTSRCSPTLNGYGNPDIETMCWMVRDDLLPVIKECVPTGATYIISTDRYRRLWRPLLGGPPRARDIDFVRAKKWALEPMADDVEFYHHDEHSARRWAEPATLTEIVIARALYGSKAEVAMAHPDGAVPLPASRDELEMVLVHTTPGDREKIAHVLFHF